MSALHQDPNSKLLLAILLLSSANWAPVQCSPLPPGSLTTVYVNKYYEVRDHDAPTKYVFNSATRIARVIGSLSTNPRLQRLRAYAGWNLYSLAVTAADAPSQLSTADPDRAPEALYKWVPQSSNFAAVTAEEALPAGTVLWLKSRTNNSLSVTGSYSSPGDLVLSGGGTFIPSAGLEAWCLTNPLPPGVAVWKRDPEVEAWRTRIAGLFQSVSDRPDIVAPGEAIYVEANAPTLLEVPEASLRIRYYHQDHLGSSAAISDATGAVMDETAFYPFGQPRNEYQPKRIREDYQFTQKEQDRESGLDYFEARYLNPLLGRFISPDPKADSDGRQNPQNGNCYAYAMSNPLKYLDPHGLFNWDASLGGNQADKDVSEGIRTQRQAFRDARQAARDAASKIAEASDKAKVLRALEAYGTEGVANDVTVGFVSSQGGSGYTQFDPGKITRNKLTSKTMHVTFDEDLASGKRAHKLAHTIAHEGTHVADYEAASKAASTDYAGAMGGALNLTYREMDTRAYTVESILGQAMGVTVSKGPGQTIYGISWAKLQPAEIAEKRAAGIQKIMESKTGENLERKILK
jgi:RHS repeat-associated protein